MSNYLEELFNSFKPVTVFALVGESGTGKSYLARLIHKYSKNSKNPFNDSSALFSSSGVNCGIFEISFK